MKKIVITGAQGTVGTVLQYGLSTEYELTLLDKNNSDLTDYNSCINNIAENTDVLIHLAWDPKPIYENGIFNNDNFVMTHNVFAAAKEKKVKRVILASSVHASEYREQYRAAMGGSTGGGPNKRADDDSQRALDGTRKRQDPWMHNIPTSIYGATKLYFEALGRYFAFHHNLEVVVLRLGGVNKQNSPTTINEPDYEKIFLSHDDLITFVKNAIEKKELEYNYWSLYAISSSPHVPNSHT